MLELLVSGFKPYKRNKIMTSIALTFNNTSFDIIDRNNQPWLRGSQIGTALGYTQGTQAVLKMFNRNSDEFTESMTSLVEIDTDGGKQQVRVFSLRGCHLLGMLSRTKIAKEFRKWVLDVLENKKFGNTEQLTSQYITEFEAYQFNKSVKAHCKSDRKAYSYAYGGIYEYYGITSYKNIPAGCLTEALEIVCGIKLVSAGNSPRLIEPQLTYGEVIKTILEIRDQEGDKAMAELRQAIRIEEIEKLAYQYRNDIFNGNFLVTVSESRVSDIKII